MSSIHGSISLPSSRAQSGRDAGGEVIGEPMAIPGVGEKTSAALLAHFKTVAAVKESKTWAAAHQKELADLGKDVDTRLAAIDADIAKVKKSQDALDGAQRKMATALGAAGIVADVRDGLERALKVDQ